MNHPLGCYEFDQLLSAEVEELAQLTAHRRDSLRHSRNGSCKPTTPSRSHSPSSRESKNRILAERDSVKRRIDGHHGEYAEARAHVNDALNLPTNCAEIYNLWVHQPAPCN
ncbi:hypothetical protein G1H11_16295 [Phytoactinopolyspora alkaliphila]|uniref:Uncharacterized protein n=1 Tax=Phytoactinopolyspora alkaliphila TaxID=1783498 RepID=A0A6N9YPU4_9ACTN|nr:hypothetical protein [Phytoactinopolyspora alkaliphila]NED96868.1 hypothetical protein [Phytoactinopolyspora alkaliphila]